MSNLHDDQRMPSTIVGYRELCRRQMREINRVGRLYLDIGGNSELLFPASAFPDFPAPHIDPPPHHPDGDEELERLCIISSSLDSGGYAPLHA